MFTVSTDTSLSAVGRSTGHARGQLEEVWVSFSRNKMAVLGMIILFIVVLLAIFADVLYDYQLYCVKMNVKNRFLPIFSPGHILGTDAYGRDLAARLIHGARYSLAISFSSVIMSMFLGGAVGAVSGYYGGKLDSVLMRIVDIIMAVPMTMLAIVIAAALGASITNMVIALTVSQIPSFARVVRGSVLTVRNMEYVEAAHSIGASDSSIIIRDIVPNILSPVVVQIAIRTAASITNAAALSFLGLGVEAPAPEWGAMLAFGRSYIRDYSYLTYLPGLAMMITILSLNLLGDGLRDAMDPRLR
jgi:peptide/nickel transport system permease protein